MIRAFDSVAVQEGSGSAASWVANSNAAAPRARIRFIKVAPKGLLYQRVSGRAPQRRPPGTSIADTRFELLLDGGEVEGARGLAGRIVLHALQEPRRERLDRHDHEGAIEEPVVVGVGVMLGLLERVAPQVEQQRHAQLDEGLAPDAEGLTAVLEKHHLPVVIARGHDLAVVVDIPELPAWRLVDLAGE